MTVDGSATVVGLPVPKVKTDRIGLCMHGEEQGNGPHGLIRNSLVEVVKLTCFRFLVLRHFLSMNHSYLI